MAYPKFIREEVKTRDSFFAQKDEPTFWLSRWLSQEDSKKTFDNKSIQVERNRERDK